MPDSTPDNSSLPPVERVRQEVDRWLEAVRSTGERAMETLGLTAAARTCSLPVDIIELSDEIVVQIEVPGLSAEGVELSLAGNMLSVTANRLRPEFPIDARYHLRERTAGKIQRSIPLPTGIDENAIQAETRDGLLTIKLKKSVPAQGRSIPITTAGN